MYELTVIMCHEPLKFSGILVAMVAILNTGIILWCVTYPSHRTVVTKDFITLLKKLMLFTWNFISDGDLSFTGFPCDFQFSWYHSFWLTTAIEINYDE
jgi:hypothetical protein